MTTLLALLILWNPVPDAASYVAQVFEVRCTLDAQGEILMVPDGFGGLRPDCRARKDTETTETEHEVPEPRRFEIYGWPGLVEGLGPCVTAVDAAGNESEPGCAP